MKALLNDGLEKEGIELFEEFGIETDTRKRDLPTLVADISQFDALVVRSATKVTREVIESGAKGKLKIIGRAGVGYDNIDVAAATRQGVIVVYTPAANSESVIEHNIGFMLALTKKICSVDRALRTGKFENREKYTGTEVDGKTLGVIGMGRTGFGTAEKCKLAFNMNIIAYDPYVTKERLEKAGFRKADNVNELLKVSDYVVICIPFTKETANLITAKELALMKKTAYLINSSRGGIVSETDLYDALRQGQIAGAAMDVWMKEPPTANHPLFSLDNFIGTPHTAGVTGESMRRIAETFAEDVSRVLRGEKPLYPVNPQVYTKS